MTFRAFLPALAGPLVLLAACGSGSSGETHEAAGDRVHVVAGFYPLQYAVERIGVVRVEVTNLTKPGTEPHDVELTPKEVAIASEADMAVYERNVQPAVADAVQAQNVANRLDVATLADESRTTTDPVVGRKDGDESRTGTVDPHFWLDPVRFGAVATGIEKTLEEVDPTHATTYRANLEALTADLSTLDADYRTGLKSCRTKTLVTSHAAFGYLADRYGLTQAAISGLSPDQEPDPAHLAAVADYAEKHGVTAIYAETLTDPAIARTVAQETGAKTLVLDPIEGITEPGADYLSVMRANLATLRTGQGCS